MRYKCQTTSHLCQVSIATDPHSPTALGSAQLAPPFRGLTVVSSISVIVTKNKYTYYLNTKNVCDYAMLSTLVAIFGSSFLDNLSLKFYKSDRPIWGQSQRRSTDSNLNLNWSQHNSRLECNKNEVTAVLLLINGVSLSFSILFCTNKILKHENSRIQLAFAFDLDSPAQRSADGCYSCPYCNASEPAVFWTRHARQPR